jgi:hypothetical protein
VHPVEIVPGNEKNKNNNCCAYQCIRIDNSFDSVKRCAENGKQEKPEKTARQWSEFIKQEQAEQIENGAPDEASYGKRYFPGEYNEHCENKKADARYEDKIIAARN